MATARVIVEKERRMEDIMTAGELDSNIREILKELCLVELSKVYHH